MNSRKRLTLILILSIIVIFFIPIISQSISLNNKPITIPKPEKIIVYNNGRHKEINESNNSYNKILRLISERLNSTDQEKQISNSENQELLLKEVNQAKNSWRCIELIYDNPIDFNLDLNNEPKESVKLKKSFFLISAEGGPDFGTDMIYGENEYSSKLKNIKTNDNIMTSLLKIIDNELS